ncbi:DUF735 family protein [Borreliella valaisiana]|uniref:Uncharacterized protein n=5 Tax=Borreliella TaxID=64895 RepID=C0R849_BORVA|nr:DUF735 family protein [Borreliella valaisiana]AIJ30271.1 hypothetical protein P613_04825 [Borreliella valaisiana Tom4006]ACN52658.1 conserved hypothetical protein [Borreliella valaisiana VS116]WKC76616.1 DUF735 family protein [Borreliella valaisiana]WLN25666.1 DUF735 family protein [Borreliella valaisiana]WVN14630.1 DUF735 family protein [Borreliella valaisiana]
MHKEIPKFLENTQIEKFIYNELDYKKEILRELKELLENFRTINVKGSINSKFIALIMLSIFNAFHFKKELGKNLVNSLDAIIFAIKSIGTDESFIVLFRAFLHANVEVSSNEDTPGEIIIKLLGNIKSPIEFNIAAKNQNKLKKITAKHLGFKKALVSNYMPKDYKNSVYEFIKILIPVGRIVKIIDKEQIEIKSTRIKNFAK